MHLGEDHLKQSFPLSLPKAEVIGLRELYLFRTRAKLAVAFSVAFTLLLQC